MELLQCAKALYRSCTLCREITLAAVCSQAQNSTQPLETSPVSVWSARCSSSLSHLKRDAELVGHNGLDRLEVDQAWRLKELEQENAKLKRLVAELSLDKLVLKDIASGNF